MDASSVEGEMEIIKGTELIEERHVEEWRGVRHVELSIWPLRSQLRVLTNNVDKMNDNDDDVMINVSSRRAYEQAYSSRTNQEITSADQGSVCLLLMDSGNGRWVRLFGVDLTPEEEAVTADPQLPGPAPSVSVIDVDDSDDEEVAPSVSVDADESDDEEVIVLSRTAFEEVLGSGRAESRSAANRRGSGETLASNQQQIRDDNMQLEGQPGPSMPEPVAPLPPPRAPFDCPICMGPFVQEVTTKCGHVFCEDCIRNAISVQSNCPTCRRKVTYRDLMRIYLPSGN